MISDLVESTLCEETETHSQGECHVSMNADIRVMLPQASAPPEAGGQAQNRASLAGLRRNQP